MGRLNLSIVDADNDDWKPSTGSSRPSGGGRRDGGHSRDRDRNRDRNRDRH